MKPIFDFSKSYSGAINNGTESFPFNLSFENSNILFSLVRPDNSLINSRMKNFSGYVSTENGIMDFTAIDAFQTMGSSNWRSYAKEQHQANSLIVTIEHNDINRFEFSKCHIEYDNIDQIGVLTWTEKDDDDKFPSFKLMRSFQELEIQNYPNSIILHNYLRYEQRNSQQNILSVNSLPYISYLPNKGTTAKEFGIFVIRLSYFLQLLFGIHQKISSLNLFANPVPDDVHRDTNYHFFNTDIIKAYIERGVRRTIHPPFDLEEIQNIDLLYINWHNFTNIQQQICRLYYGEINSKEYIKDDRFKNLCSIIQSLEAFGFLSEIPRVKGDMNAKLRKATSPELQTLLFGTKNEIFMIKLFEIIGTQRDHYQHLNKPLKFDLNKNSEDIVVVNSLLAAIIRYHLLRAIGLDPDKIEKIISVDVSYLRPRLDSLKLRLKIKE